MTRTTRPPALISALILALTAAAATSAAFARATKYPEKPITFVVPFAAGSATDQLARALGNSITEQTKQAVVVDNKAGDPNKLSFGSGSSSSRVAGEMFKQMSHTEILHVPYKSNPNAITDLLGGQIDMMITDTEQDVALSP